ncbi:MAG: RsmB/NOP family class I SAM-dependent RNA methyltransferase [Thermaurantiacus sp.]
MRDSARLQAAIEILDAVIEAARTEGAAADTLIARYFASRRYAGSGDRAAVRELVWEAIRTFGEPPCSGRAAMVSLALSRRPDLLPMFDGSQHAAKPIAAGEAANLPAPVPLWLVPMLEKSLGVDWEQETNALLGRAPLDIRVNALKARSQDEIRHVADALPASATPITGLPRVLPHALRLAEPVALDRHPLHGAGLFEVQDAGSQLAAAMCEASAGETVVDLCAGAGGKTLALAAAMAGRGRLIAADTDRRRLSQLAPRAERAGAFCIIEARLLNPGREIGALGDVTEQADCVVVDAPCSGSGTWRRNPELRWRLSPARLERVLRLQAHLLDVAVALVRPGGRLVYIVCSVLQQEGFQQVQGIVERAAFSARKLELCEALQLTPARHGCDGFFVARLRKLW